MCKNNYILFNIFCPGFQRTYTQFFVHPESKSLVKKCCLSINWIVFFLDFCNRLKNKKWAVLSRFWASFMTSINKVRQKNWNSSIRICCALCWLEFFNFCTVLWSAHFLSTHFYPVSFRLLVVLYSQVYSW